MATGLRQGRGIRHVGTGVGKGFRGSSRNRCLQMPGGLQKYAIVNEQIQRFHRDYPSATAAQVDVTKLGGEAATPDKR